MIHRIISTLLAAPALLFLCSQASANLLENGDFTQGTYSDTAAVQIEPGVSLTNTVNVPNEWTVSSGFHYPYFNSTGLGYVLLGNNTGQPIASISQTFSDTAGLTYQVMFDLSGTGLPYSTWFFSALLDGNTGFNIIPNGRFDSEFGFAFVGTGSDTFTFEGVNSSEPYRMSQSLLLLCPFLDDDAVRTCWPLLVR